MEGIQMIKEREKELIEIYKEGLLLQKLIYGDIE